MVDAREPRLKALTQPSYKEIAYSLDALVLGLSLWCGLLKIWPWGSFSEKKLTLVAFTVLYVWLSCSLDKEFSALIVGAMTFDKHKLDGIPQIQSKTLHPENFEGFLINAGYSRLGVAPAQGK